MHVASIWENVQGKPKNIFYFFFLSLFFYLLRNEIDIIFLFSFYYILEVLPKIYIEHKLSFNTLKKHVINWISHMLSFEYIFYETRSENVIKQPLA